MKDRGLSLSMAILFGIVASVVIIVVCTESRISTWLVTFYPLGTSPGLDFGQVTLVSILVQVANALLWGGLERIGVFDRLGGRRS